ncbi:hypothetical protein L228DRAFT_104560 [Xylona heveae TC161]|uniref:F-box domain-containing protein n=1 Tax=Xylona heveae (strain CBS 132557 / TC161) TaxID=1328760 RepID=A0A165H7U3_XYLHT|nr:hypothetical protein L228DRAFT_104560 [Xylona heveae TC161]KZF23105.1 hypothetical protein L228DRAFT_104560 [Xylona heveae TC161]
MQSEPSKAENSTLTSVPIKEHSSSHSQHGKRRADKIPGGDEGLRKSPLSSTPREEVQSQNLPLRPENGQAQQQENGMKKGEVHVTQVDATETRAAEGKLAPTAVATPITSNINGSHNDTDPMTSRPSPERVESHTIGDATLTPSLFGEPSPRTDLGHHPSADRITQYEQALSPSPSKRHQSLGFQVIKSRVVRPGVNRSPLAEFPNEVLTHVLSYLPPSSLSAVALVSRRFRDLVTTPHSWRVAFSRFFPGLDAFQLLGSSIFSDNDSDDGIDELRSEKRVFTRLSALASWRSEYILRTRLLRSLGRGKPVQLQQSPATPSRSGSTQGNAVNTYYSQHYTTVNHIHVTFGAGLNKKLPKFIHGADEDGSSRLSDPLTGKVDAWGLTDPQRFLQFSDTHPGDAPYGLGPGELVGAPNVMDVSQPFGSVYGEGTPGGSVYYRSTEEMRGRFLLGSVAHATPEKGIPKVPTQAESINSVWIAKSNMIPSMSDGLIGILSGSSCGIVTAYSFGADGLNDQRLGRGEITARWVLSPGVPIISIVVDEVFSAKRFAKSRIWAVALNALGEVFYLSEFPKRHEIDRQARLDLLETERLAWSTGRTVQWTLVEPTRRLARVDPYSRSEVDGSYTPRSSWDGVGLGREQLMAETREIEKFLNFQPKHFRKICQGWDMRRRLEVDFAGDDGNDAGEAIFVIGCGLDHGTTADVKRFVRFRVNQGQRFGSGPSTPQATPVIKPTIPGKKPSLFGGPVGEVSDVPLPPASDTSGPSTPELLASRNSPQQAYEEWRLSKYEFGSLKGSQITVSAIDKSAYAQLTASEDPLLNLSGLSAASTPLATPPQEPYRSLNMSDVPGHRARFLAVGTKTGSILVWDMRAAPPANADIDNVVTPIRVIHTDSPQISCLALSALYLVHGGNDGLVQAWDPLASTLSPIRTLHSRFSSRARRRLVQAEASIEGVGINLFAAGAVFLDPDPTVLRGMVSLGTYLRYWSYSSSAAEQYKSQKRRLRRSERGSNAGGERFSGSGRGAMRGYIANEQHELEVEKAQKRREAERFAGRFGTELLGKDATEEDILAYAALLSEESLKAEQERRESEIANVAYGDASTIAEAGSAAFDGPSTGATPAANASGNTAVSKISAANVPDTDPGSTEHLIQEDEELDPELAQAIRLSLEEAANSPTAAAHLPDVPVRWGKGAKPPSPSWQLPEDFDPAWLAEDDTVSGAPGFGSSKVIHDPPFGYYSSTNGNGLGSSGSGSGSNSRADAIAQSAKEHSQPHESNDTNQMDMSDDLDFALQLSLAEEQSRREAQAQAEAEAKANALMAPAIENENTPSGADVGAEVGDDTSAGASNDKRRSSSRSSSTATGDDTPVDPPTTAFSVTHNIPRKDSLDGSVAAAAVLDDKDFPALGPSSHTRASGQSRSSTKKGKGRAMS